MKEVPERGSVSIAYALLFAPSCNVLVYWYRMYLVFELIAHVIRITHYILLAAYAFLSRFTPLLGTKINHLLDFETSTSRCVVHWLGCWANNHNSLLDVLLLFGCLDLTNDTVAPISQIGRLHLVAIIGISHFAKR